VFVRDSINAVKKRETREDEKGGRKRESALERVGERGRDSSAFILVLVKYKVTAIIFSQMIAVL